MRALAHPWVRGAYTLRRYIVSIINIMKVGSAREANSVRVGANSKCCSLHCTLYNGAFCD